MQVEIYLDVQFLTEWVMDMCVVLLTAGITGKQVRPGRAALASALGALVHVGWLAACVLSGQNPQGAGAWIVALLLVPVMNGIAFPRKAMSGCKTNMGQHQVHRRSREVLLLWAAFAASAFLLAGILQVLHPFWQRMFFRFWLAVFAAYAVLQTGLKLFEVAKHRQMDLCPVQLYLGDIKLQVMALRDTGNRLQDPWLHRPVSILEEGALPFPMEELFPREELKVHFIPYCSVGCPSGVLTGFVFTRMVVEGENGAQVIQAPVIGISKGTVSTEKVYQMILNEKFRQ